MLWGEIDIVATNKNLFTQLINLSPYFLTHFVPLHVIGKAQYFRAKNMLFLTQTPNCQL